MYARKVLELLLGLWNWVLLLRSSMFACLIQICKMLQTEELVYTPNLMVLDGPRCHIALAPLHHLDMKEARSPLLLCSDAST